MRKAVRYSASRCLSASSSNRARLAAASRWSDLSAPAADSAFTAYSLRNAGSAPAIPPALGRGGELLHVGEIVRLALRPASIGHSHEACVAAKIRQSTRVEI